MATRPNQAMNPSGNCGRVFDEVNVARRHSRRVIANVLCDKHAMATVYIETSIIGYLTARSSDAVIFLARQQLTQQWWHHQRSKYELVTSQLVLDEAGAGDPNAAEERLRLLDPLPLLDIEDPNVSPLADELVAQHLLPEKAAADARHVAVATVFEVDYLLTWNCKHIANAETLPRIYRMLRDSGYEPPLIATPEEFSENV